MKRTLSLFTRLLGDSWVLYQDCLWLFNQMLWSSWEFLGSMNFINIPSDVEECWRSFTVLIAPSRSFLYSIKKRFFLLRVGNRIDRTCLDFQYNFRNSWRNSNDSLKSFWDLLNFSRSSLKSLTVLRFDRFIPFLFVWWSLIAESWWQIIHNRSQLREHNRIFEKGIASLKKERRMRVMDEIHNESVCLRLSAFVYGSE